MEENTKSIPKQNIRQMVDIMERIEQASKKQETTVIRFEVNMRMGHIEDLFWDTTIVRRYDPKRNAL